MIKKYEYVFEGVLFGVLWLSVLLAVIEDMVSCFKGSLTADGDQKCNLLQRWKQGKETESLKCLTIVC